MNLSHFAFGTASVGSRIRYPRFMRLADMALQAGIHRFDTAPSYGRGLAQVFLQRFANERPGTGLRASTKVGRLPVGDPKSLLIVMSQGELRHAARLSRHRSGMACDFSAANLDRCLAFARQSMDPSLFDALFLHASPQPMLARGAAESLHRMADGTMQIGVAEPCQADLDWILEQDSADWALQVSMTDFMSEPRLQRLKGTLWINSIIRYARAQSIGLQATMDALRTRRGGNCIYVVGFNHEHLFDDFLSID